MVLIGDGVAVHLLELILKAVNGCKLRVFEGVGGILIYLHKARLVSEHADYLIEVFELLGILLIGVVDKGTDGVLVHKVGVVCLSASVVCGMGSFKEDLFVKDVKRPLSVGSGKGRLFVGIFSLHDLSGGIYRICGMDLQNVVGAVYGDGIASASLLCLKDDASCKVFRMILCRIPARLTGGVPLFVIEPHIQPVVEKRLCALGEPLKTHRVGDIFVCPRDVCNDSADAEVLHFLDSRKEL